jgi:hypothetical protein
MLYAIDAVLLKLRRKHDFRPRGETARKRNKRTWTNNRKSDPKACESEKHKKQANKQTSKTRQDD